MDRIKLNLNIYFKNKIKRLRFNPQLESDKGYYKIELKNFYQVHKELGENIVPKKRFQTPIILENIWRGHIFNTTINVESWVEKHTGVIKLTGPNISQKKFDLNNTPKFQEQYKQLIKQQKIKSKELEQIDEKRSKKLKTKIPNVITHKDKFSFFCSQYDFSSDLCVKNMPIISNEQR